MRSSDIPGQDELKQVFARLVESQRLPHAMLIQGNEGGSGLPLAMFLSQYLLCHNRKDGEVCGTCDSCQKAAKAVHPDIHFIIPVNTTKSIKKKDLIHSESFLDQLRDLLLENPFSSLQDWYKVLDIDNKQGFIGELESSKLREKLALRSYEGGSRVFIIWNPELMNQAFANKILKSLEEPNPNTHFILVAERPGALLPTILSRVQRFKEEHISEEALSEYLAQRYNIDREEAFKIAFRSEGNINAAIKEIEQRGEPWLEEFKQWMRLAYTRDIAALFEWSQKMAGSTREAERQFINGALKVLDRCFRMGWIDVNIPMEGEEAAFYKNFSPFINAANIEGLMQLLEEASFHIERNLNQRIVWFDTSIKAVRLIHEGKKSAASA